MKGDEIFWGFDRHCVETVTLTKHVSEYKYMRKFMLEFPRKVWESWQWNFPSSFDSRWETIDFLQYHTCNSSASDVILSHRFLWGILAVNLLSLYILVRLPPADNIFVLLSKKKSEFLLTHNIFVNCDTKIY